eukprot:TRINITY_DN30635_c0_g1_i2.p1 TRINITY_DN30635_c0_g1~~TRINITY_DN30635_c0_g1_i2.p1  ORF type:complete len:108 (+),score=0.14 TRINITY_DN30635_c0_g1_i2:172-495(+)
MLGRSISFKCLSCLPLGSKPSPNTFDNIAKWQPQRDHQMRQSHTNSIIESHVLSELFALKSVSKMGLDAFAKVPHQYHRKGIFRYSRRRTGEIATFPQAEISHCTCL